MISLRLRLTLWYLGLTITVLLAFDVVSYWVLSTSLQAEIDHTLSERANHVSDALAVVPNRPIAGIAPEATDEFRSPGVYVQILDVKGNVMVRSFNLGRQELPIGAADRQQALLTEEYQTVEVDGQPVRVYYRPLRRNGVTVGAVQVGQSLTGLESTLARLRIIYAIGTGLILLVGFAGSWWIVRYGLQPVVQVTQTAQEIVQAEDLSQRVSYTGPSDEIGALAATFNQMLDRLQTIFDSQRRFLAEAAHELRTPLASMLGNVDLLVHYDHDATRRREAASAVQRTGKHVARLLDDLLLLAQAETGWHLQRQPVAIDDVFLEAYEAMLPVSGDVRLELQRCDPAWIEGDADRLRQVFTNLINNALNYSEPGDTVNLFLWPEAERVWARISDTGCGMAPGALARAYEPFFREAGQTRRAGAGLGLAIAHWIVQEHDGKIEIESSQGQGTTVLLSFPELTPS